MRPIVTAALLMGLAPAARAQSFQATTPSVGDFGAWAATSGVTPLVGDFNGDGRADVALTGAQGWGTVPVALSQVDGSFAVHNNPAAEFAALAAGSGVQPRVGDFNGDGRDDIVLVGGSGKTTLPMVLGEAGGQWQFRNAAVPNFPGWVGLPGASVLVGRFNHDSADDLLATGVAGWGTVPVAFSTGNGGFNVTNNGVAYFPDWASHAGVQTLVGDFNGSGIDDVMLLGSAGFGHIPGVFNNSNGNFGPAAMLAGDFPIWAASPGAQQLVGDFNGDGKADLAMTGVAGWGSVPVALNNGNTTWNVVNQPLANFPGWAASAKAHVGDFNGDRLDDIALVGVGSWGSIPVALSNGDGTFRVANEVGVGAFASATATGGATTLVGAFTGAGQDSLVAVGAPGWSYLHLASMAHATQAEAPAPATPQGGAAGNGIDPVAEAAKHLGAASAVLQPLTGILYLDGASYGTLGGGEVFKLAGRIDGSRINTGHPLGLLIYQTIKLLQSVGVPATVGMEVSLTQANNELDLAIAFILADGWWMAPALPTINTQLAFKQAKLVLHAKQAMAGGAPSFTTEATGEMFVRPSRWDPWLNLQPTLEVDNQGTLTFGGALSGACSGTPSASTTAASCAQTWNLLSAGLAKADGGMLKLTVNSSGVPQGIEASVRNGRLMSGTTIDGAVLVDTDLSPGAGVSFKTSGTDLNGVMNSLPFSDVEPFATIKKGTAQLPSSGLSPVGPTEMTLTPTGLQVGHVNINGPMYQYKGSFTAGATTQTVDASFHLQPSALESGDLLSGASGHMRITVDFSGIEQTVLAACSAIPVLGPIASEITNSLRFHGATVDVNVASRSGAASLDFEVFERRFRPYVPLDMVFQPDRLVPYLVTLIEHHAADLGKIVLQGLEAAGKTIAEGGTVVGEGIVTGAEEVGGAFEDFGGLVGDLFASSPNNWDMTQSAYPPPVLDITWFQQTHSPNDPDLWRNIWLFHNPFFKNHPHGWSVNFNPETYLDENPDILAHAEANKNAFVDTVWNTGGVYAWTYPAHHRGLIAPNDDRYLTYVDWAPAAGTVLPNRGKYAPYQRYAAFDHYLHYGLSEGRVGSRHFSPKYYVFKYPDVAAAYSGKGWWDVVQHYRNAGRAEGRQGVPSAAGLKGRVPAAIPPGNVNQYPCRAIIPSGGRKGQMLAGTWHYGVSAQCEIATDPGWVYRAVVFEVYDADAMSWGNVNGATSAIASIRANGVPVEVCSAKANGHHRFGWINEAGQCLIGSMDRATGIVGAEPSRPQFVGGNWVVP